MLTRLTIRWNSSMGCYRVNEPEWPGGVVVPADYHDATVQQLRGVLMDVADWMDHIEGEARLRRSQVRDRIRDELGQSDG